MPSGLGFGLLASLAWGMTDLSGALAARRVGSVGVLAGTQLTSLAVLLVIAAANRTLLGGHAARGRDGAVPGHRSRPPPTSRSTRRCGSGRSASCRRSSRRTAGSRSCSRSSSAASRWRRSRRSGAAVATLGIVLTGLVLGGSIRETRIVGPGVIVALVTMALFAILTVALAGPIKEYGWLPVMLGSRVSNTTVGVLLLVLALARRDGPIGALLGPPGGFGRRALVLVLVAGVCDLLGFVAYTIGLEVAETWLVGLASSFGPALVVLVAVAFLGERLRPSQWVGLGMLAAGLVVLALAG